MCIHTDLVAQLKTTFSVLLIPELVKQMPKQFYNELVLANELLSHYTKRTNKT